MERTLRDNLCYTVFRSIKLSGSFGSGNNKLIQEAPLPRRAQRVRRASLVYFVTFIGDKQQINS